MSHPQSFMHTQLLPVHIIVWLHVIPFHHYSVLLGFVIRIKYSLYSNLPKHQFSLLLYETLHLQNIILHAIHQTVELIPISAHLYIRFPNLCYLNSFCIVHQPFVHNRLYLNVPKILFLISRNPVGNLNRVSKQYHLTLNFAYLHAI